MIQFRKMRLHFLYYYVRPCPRCGSRCTGRCMRRPLVDAAHVEEESLKHGEIVRFTSAVPKKNCFCVDCGFCFRYTVRTRWLTREEMAEEQAERGTEEAYAELKRENDSAADEKRRRPANRVFRWIFSR